MSSTLMRALRALVFTPAAFKQAVSRTAFVPSGLPPSFIKRIWCVALPRGEVQTRRHVVNNRFFPNVTLPASDRRRLERLAQAGADQGDVDARFLLSEINRAEVVPDRAARLDSIVTMGSWVTLHLWLPPRDKATGVPRRLHVRANPNPRDVAVGRSVGRAEGRKRNPLLHRWAHQRRQGRTCQPR